MAAKPATEAGRAQDAERKWLSEAPVGWIKQAPGFRRFSVRGLYKVRGEWDLVCLALNIKRMRGCSAAAWPGFRPALGRNEGRFGPS